MKAIFKAILCSALMFTAVSCNKTDDEPTVNDEKDFSVFIINEGNFYSGVDGSLNGINLSEKSIGKNLFLTANGRNLGNTPTCGIFVNDKLIIGVEYSNTIEVLDENYKSIKQIKLSDTSAGTQPFSMIKDDKYVYISMFDGYVARFDPSTLEIDKSVKVGPNPENIAIHQGKIYVPCTDGMNYPNYGTTASVIDINKFEVEKTITVPINPRKFMSVDGKLFLLTGGDYAANLATLYEINTANYTATPIAPATMATSYKSDIYLIDTPFSEDGVKIDYKKYNVTKSEMQAFGYDTKGLEYPNAIAADPNTGNLVITSLVYDGQWPSYVLPGYAIVYSKDGSQIGKFDMGAGTSHIFFR